MIQAIIFDCFGVLTNDGWRDLRHTYGTSPEILERFSYLDRVVNDSEMPYKQFITEIAQLTGLSEIDVNKLFDQRNNNEQLLDYIRDELKPKYKIAMLSNAAKNWLDEIFTSDQIAMFDSVTLSCEVGIMKPDEAIYQLAIHALGVPPEACLFVDDVKQYCETAERLGMRTILYTDFMTCRAQITALLS